MDLHLHLSAAFRALDRKWGPVVDLDNSGDSHFCLPAEIERPSTTFSSEMFLKKVRRSRPKPYSRTEERRRRNNVKKNDSFSNISVSRMPSYKDEDQNSFICMTCPCDTCVSSVLGTMNHLNEDLQKPLEETIVLPSIRSSRPVLDSSLQRKDQFNNMLNELRVNAVSYIGKKLKRKVEK